MIPYIEVYNNGMEQFFPVMQLLLTCINGSIDLPHYLQKLQNFVEECSIPFSTNTILHEYGIEGWSLEKANSRSFVFYRDSGGSKEMQLHPVPKY